MQAACKATGQGIGKAAAPGVGLDAAAGQQLGRTIVGSSHSCAIGSRAAGSLLLQLGILKAAGATWQRFLGKTAG